jgi:hypothetical protein
MSILSDLTSGNADQIWEGACAIRDLRDLRELRELALHLPEIRSKTEGIRLGGAVRPNSSHLEFALRKLEFVADPSGCLCRLYPQDDLFSPEREEGAGAVRILDRVLKNGYLDFYLCECTSCAQRYRVEEGEYHYTWWKWEEAPNQSST